MRCTRCSGFGTIYATSEDEADENEFWQPVVICPDCNGEGITTN